MPSYIQIAKKASTILFITIVLFGFIASLPTSTCNTQWGITIVSDGNCTVDPDGLTYVSDGGTLTVYYSANTGFRMDTLIIDFGLPGEQFISVSTDGSYTFTNVREVHSLTALATPITYTVTTGVYSEVGGSIDPSGETTVNYGGDLTIDYTADGGYRVGGAFIDGIYSVVPGYGASGGSYTFSDVTADHTFVIVFDLISYSITPSCDEHSSISPSTPQSVNHGSSKTFHYSAAAGYTITSVLVDGAPINLTKYPSSYTFTDVTADHTIAVASARNIYCSQTAISNAVANKSTVFSTLWNSSAYDLSGYIASTNATGSWVNQTWTAFSGSPWGNYTFTAPSTVGQMVGYIMYANDTGGNWANSTLQTFTTTGYYVTVTSSYGSPTASGYVCYGGTFATSVTSPVVIDPTHQYVCTGYSVDGGETVSGTSYNFIDVSTNHTITYYWEEQYISEGGDCTVAMQAFDTDGNLLPATKFTLNGTDYQTVSGAFSFIGLSSGDILTGSASWQGVTVNASFTITVTGNMTYEVICAVYPYIYGSTTYHCATDRNVSNTVWDGTHFGVGFQEADSAKTIVFTAPRIPTYIAGIAYDLDTAWNSSSQVFKATLPADTVILTVNFDNWGSGFYLQQISTPVSSVSWSGNALTFTFPGESTGSFTLRCGSRGLPAATTGVSAPAYDAATTFFTALYTSRTALTLDWTQQGGSGDGGGGGSGGGGSPSGGAFTLLVEPNFGTYYRGSNGTATLTLKFSGTPNFNVLSVIISGDGRSFIQPVTPPTSPFYSGTGTLTLDLNIPSNAAPGAYTVTVVVSGLDANGIQRSATAQATLTVASETQSGGEPISGVPQNMVQIVAVVIILAAVSVAALAIITRRQ